MNHDKAWDPLPARVTSGKVLQAASRLLLYSACFLLVICAPAKGREACKTLLPPSHSCQFTPPALNFLSTFLKEEVKERYGNVGSRKEANKSTLAVCLHM